MFSGSPFGQAFLAIRVGNPFCPMGARLGRISRGTRGCPDRWGLSLHFKASGPLPPSQTLLANARSQTLQVNPTGQILLAIEPSLPSQNLRANPSRPIPLGQSSKSSHTRQTIWPNLSKSPPRSQPFRVQTCWAILFSARRCNLTPRKTMKADFKSPSALRCDGHSGLAVNIVAGNRGEADGLCGNKL